MFARTPRHSQCEDVPSSVVLDFEQGEIGPDLFRHACLMGLPGIETS